MFFRGIWFRSRLALALLAVVVSGLLGSSSLLGELRLPDLKPARQEATPAKAEEAQAEEAKGEPQSTARRETLEERLKILELQEGEVNFRKDWWKYLLMTLGGALALYVLVRVTRMLVRMILCLAGLAAGFLGGLLFGAPLANLISPHLPETIAEVITPLHIARTIAFLLTYTVAIAIGSYLLRPMKEKTSDQKL